MSNTVTQCGKVEWIHKYEDIVLHYSKVWWYLYTLDGMLIYRYPTFGGKLIIDLSDTDRYYLYPGTKIVLKARAEGDHTQTSDVYMEYSPDSDRMAIYEMTHNGTLIYKKTV